MESERAAAQRVIVVTGLSGAGKSTALNALEDLGFFCVDNLPPPVVAGTLASLHSAGFLRVALGIDVRARSFLEGAADVIRAVKQAGNIDLTVLYLDSSQELLARRFSSTRRPHPLSTGQQAGVRAVLEGIRLERELLAPMRGLAGVVIDTTTQSIHDLRSAVVARFGAEEAGGPGFFVRVVSFGFKYGAPHDADLMFDVRFLPNPYFVEELTHLSGKDEAVSDYVLSNPDAQGFLERVEPLLLYCLPRFRKEGKSYVTIGIGCTGGRHRSVALTEHLAKHLSQGLGSPVDAVHRDVNLAERGQ